MTESRDKVLSFLEDYQKICEQHEMVIYNFSPTAWEKFRMHQRDDVLYIISTVKSHVEDYVQELVENQKEHKLNGYE